jgi:glycosyltransferase involved in cell wall biosynthesis
MSEPLVSVVMPVYNGERFLAEAIESVLGQEYRNHEVIVVDDGSTDGSSAVARALGVRYVRQPNRGVAAARNTGLAAAQGTLISFLDQDDVWLPGKLEAQVGLLEASPCVDLVVSAIQIVLEPDTEPLPWFDPGLGMEIQTVVQLGAMLARRGCFDVVGAFDPSYAYASDTDWILRVRDAGLVLETTDDVCMRYRLHEDNSSRHEDLLQAEVRRAYRASVARKRAARLRSEAGIS